MGVPLGVTSGSIGTQGPHGVGGWVMSHEGVTLLDADFGVCGAIGSPWVVILGSGGGEIPLGVTWGSVEG